MHVGPRSSIRLKMRDRARISSKPVDHDRNQSIESGSSNDAITLRVVGHRLPPDNIRLLRIHVIAGQHRQRAIFVRADHRQPSLGAERLTNIAVSHLPPTITRHT